MPALNKTNLNCFSCRFPWDDVIHGLHSKQSNSFSSHVNKKPEGWKCCVCVSHVTLLHLFSKMKQERTQNYVSGFSVFMVFVKQYSVSDLLGFVCRQ